MSFDAEREICLCAQNAIASTNGCTPCADDEVVTGTTCGCPAGTAKNDTNVCAVVAGLGDACEDHTQCADSTYSFCAPMTAGTTAGTCTKMCASDDDCGGAYTCATWEAQPYCRQFSGVGATCAAQEDCAGLDAQACDTFQTHTCMIAGCSLDDGDCPRGMECCDLSAFGAGTICMPGCP
jgi:hypothetical protein